LLYTFGFAALFLFAFNLAPTASVPGAAETPADFWWLGSALAGWGFLLLLAAGPTVLGFGLYNVALGHLPSSVVNLLVTSELLFTTAQAYLFLGERLQVTELGGGLLILIGVVVLRWREGWRERRAAEVVV
jgi:drug/metabolite transporter (DMT)-like permease